MTLPKFFKRKTTYVALAVLVGGGWWLVSARHRNPASNYELSNAVRRDLAQTVEVTGLMKPASRINLSFNLTGTLQKINVAVGTQVKAGTVLASLDAEDARYAVHNAASGLAAARANLDLKLAGQTAQTIAVAEAQVEQAQANADKAVADLASTGQTTQQSIETAQIALRTAQNNLNNQDAIVSQNVANAVDAARLDLLTALGPLNTGLADGDQISGVDNVTSNQGYVTLLGLLDSGSLDRSKNSYAPAKAAKLDAEASVKVLSSASSKEDIQAAAGKLQTAITLVQAYLAEVQKVLAASLTNTIFTDAALAAKRSAIDADRTAVSSQNTSVLSALQSIRNMQLVRVQTVQQLQDALETAQTAFDTARTNAAVQIRASQTNAAIQKAALDSARAALDVQRAPPRRVDLAPLRAAADQAAVAYDKAQHDLQKSEIIAPVDGTISEILPSLGEQIAPDAPVVRMVGTRSYAIEAKVPEADIIKIAPGQTASVTLDAYGDEVRFRGTVVDKDPAETLVQDAVYYKIHVQVQPGGRELKPGMTANVTVMTGMREQAVVIPLRAVRTDATTQKKTVRIFLNDQPVVRDVVLGLRGDEGMVEAVSGVNPGDQVIVSEKTSPAPS